MPWPTDNLPLRDPATLRRNGRKGCRASPWSRGPTLNTHKARQSWEQIQKNRQEDKP
jgi:hypothetical protein